MGANAQTSVPVFTSGQVLTAQQQTEINTGIPVFADSTARDAAFGGTGLKTLAEGQFAFLEDTDTTQYYDGSTWNAVGGASGLAFVTGATFTTATSFSLPTDTFTSTYKNYRMIVVLTALTADADFTLRTRAAGTDDSSSNYFNAQLGTTSAGSGSNITTQSATSWNVGESDSATITYSLVLDIFQPKITIRHSCLGLMTCIDKTASTFIFRTMGLQTASTTAYDSLSFISSVASSMTGSYRVYGYSES
jgi:hypothetical protein